MRNRGAGERSRHILTPREHTALSEHHESVATSLGEQAAAFESGGGGATAQRLRDTATANAHAARAQRAAAAGAEARARGDVRGARRFYREASRWQRSAASRFARVSQSRAERSAADRARGLDREAHHEEMQADTFRANAERHAELSAAFADEARATAPERDGLVRRARLADPSDRRAHELRRMGALVPVTIHRDLVSGAPARPSVRQSPAGRSSGASQESRHELRRGGAVVPVDIAR
jgi:hypothetical protein